MLQRFLQIPCLAFNKKYCYLFLEHLLYQKTFTFLISFNPQNNPEREGVSLILTFKRQPGFTEVSNLFR